ncbi:hypothetical protein MNBD_GAMMA09-2023 [hydrothermal vent metagenome]|uniref:Sulfotransferase n=1 Tax=hydrothermal vent metagenome TaxID=652676 RepID=A0A3B0Y3R2_9ZZZZ
MLEKNTDINALKTADGKDSDKKQVFIIGSRRSGTTWTLWLLSNHPSMVGLQHTNLIDAFKKLNDWWLDEERIHNSIVSGKDEKIKANLKDFIEEKSFYSSCRQLLDMIFQQAFNEKKQASVVVESQPENVENLDLLMKLFPDAYYLHVIRDPRSVFGSWKSIATTWSSSDIFNTHPADFSDRWRSDISMGRSFSDKADHYMEIKYEDLKSDGVTALKRVYKWIGVDASTDIAQQALDACEMKKLRKKGNMPKGFFRKGSSEGWKSDLSAADVQAVEYLLKDIMDDFSYKRVNTGELSKPVALKLHSIKKQIKGWLRNTWVFALLRKFKKRLIG